MKGFVNFVREQGVIGLAIGFILGGAVAKVVSALVSDIINPILGFLLGNVGNLADASVKIGSAKLMWGDFVNTVIDFLIIALVIYFLFFKLLKLDQLDKTDKK